MKAHYLCRKPVRAGSILFISALLWCLMPTSRAADPLGAYRGLGQGPGRLIKVMPLHLSPVYSSGALPPAWTGQPLSLAQLSWLALHHNPKTRLAWAQLQAQAALLGQARSAEWPSLTLTVPMQRRRATTAAGYALPQQDTTSPNLSLSFLIWDFGHRSKLIDQAQASLRASVYLQNEAVQAVLYGVQQAYYTVLGDHALIVSYQAAVRQNREALLSAEALHRAGRATVSDLYQSRAALALAQANVDMARQTLRSDEGSLDMAIGLPLGTSIPLASLDIAAPPTLIESVKAYLRTALLQNPGLQGAQYEVRAARAGLGVARRSDLPTVSLGMDQGWYAQRGIGMTRQYSLGITLTVPLFTGFSHHYQIAEARAQLAQARASLQNTINNTQLSVWRAYYAFRSATLALPNAHAQEENAAKALAAVKAQYHVGLATIQDLLGAQSELTAARVSVVRDAINSYLALAGLSSAVGRLSMPQHLPVP